MSDTEIISREDLEKNAAINTLVLDDLRKDRPPQQLTSELAKSIENAEIRWAWAKTHIEPHIKEASNDEDAVGFLPNCEFLLREAAKSVCVEKGRKQGHSWAIALKALSRAATEPRSTTIIGSFDEDEAGEKRQFLDWQYGVLERDYRRELNMSDGSAVRYFSNGSRIKFIARKAPTGAGASIEWDEFSVEQQGRVSAGEILVAALGATTHTGTVSIGGTQRGPDTIFNKIVTGEITKEIAENPFFAPFKSKMGRVWVVGSFPWWTCQALCKDVPKVVAMGKRVKEMDTRERVEMFGNDKLVDQFIMYCSTPTLGLELFQREFETMVLDDRESYFPLALIQYCYPKGKAAHDYWFEHETINGVKYGAYGDALTNAKTKIRMLASAIKAGILNGEWGFAMDIGLDNDQDEIWIGHTPREDRGMLCLRLSIGAHKLPFDGKMELVQFILKTLPITRGYLDGTKGSVGRQMATQLAQRYGQRAAIFEFTNASKQIIASNMKARMEDGKLILPPYQPKFTKLQDQLLKVVKYITPSRNVIFDVERNAQYHGDCMWSAAMLNDLFYQAKRWAPAPPAVGRQSHAPSRMEKPQLTR